MSGGPACLQLEPRNSARSSVSVGAAAGAGAGLLVGRHPKVPAGPFFWAWAGGVGGALGAALGAWVGSWFGDTEADEYSAVGGVFVVALLGSVLGGIVGGALDGGLADLPPGALRGVLPGLCLALLMVLLAGLARKVLFRLGTLPVLGLAGGAAAACAAGLPDLKFGRLVDLKAGEVRVRLEGDYTALNDLAFTPGGERAVGGAQSQEAYLWDLAGGTVLKKQKLSVATTVYHRATGHTTPSSSDLPIKRVAALPGGKRALLVAGDTRELEAHLAIWDLEKGRLVSQLHAHKDEVRALSLTPDGRRALTASKDKTLTVWRIDPDAPHLALLPVKAIEAQEELAAAALSPDARVAVGAVGGIGGLDGTQDQGGLDVRCRHGQALPGTAEATVVELGGLELVEAGQAGLLGPLAEAVQRPGPNQAVGDQDLGERAQGDIALPGDEAVDGVGEVQLVEEGLDDGQGPDHPRLHWHQC